MCVSSIRLSFVGYPATYNTEQVRISGDKHRCLSDGNGND
jgi:hypothetical protein